MSEKPKNKICGLCVRFVDEDHVCEIKPKETEGLLPYLHPSAVPTRTGKESGP